MTSKRVQDASGDGPYSDAVDDFSDSDETPELDVLARRLAKKDGVDLDAARAVVLGAWIAMDEEDEEQHRSEGAIGAGESDATSRPRPTIGAGLEAGIHRHATIQADGLYERGSITREERIALSSALGRALERYVKVVEAKAPQMYRLSKRGYSAPGGASLPSAEYAKERLVAKAGLDATLKKLSDVSGITPRQILDDLTAYMRRNDITNPSKQEVHDFVVESYGSGVE